MKITSFYYHEYSDGKIPNPKIAYSGVTVEVGQDDAGINDFDAAYFFHVATIGYIKSNNFQLKKDFVTLKSLIIVSRFEDAIVRAALQGILDKISEYGIFDALDYPLYKQMGS